MKGLSYKGIAVLGLNTHKQAVHNEHKDTLQWLKARIRLHLLPPDPRLNTSDKNVSGLLELAEANMSRFLLQVDKLYQANKVAGRGRPFYIDAEALKAFLGIDSTKDDYFFVYAAYLEQCIKELSICLNKIKNYPEKEWSERHHTINSALDLLGWLPQHQLHKYPTKSTA